MESGDQQHGDRLPELERVARQFLAGFRSHAFRSVVFEVEFTERDGDHGVVAGLKTRVRVELFDGTMSTLEEEADGLREYSMQGLVGALAATLDDWHDALETALKSHASAIPCDRAMVVDDLGVSFRNL